MKIKFFFLILFIPLYGVSQSNYTMETKDINNFWNAFDLLKTAKTKQDSIGIFQTHYLDKGSSFFKEFIEAKNLTAEEYVEKINRYPKFWASVRPLTEDLQHQKLKFDSLFQIYSQRLPKYKQPDICFAIGCLRTGGTTSKNLILIGAEIAAANDEVDKSEMNGWLKEVIGQTGNILALIAHETIHTQQKDHRLIVGKKNALLEQSLKEGVADFITSYFFGLNINQKNFQYGENHQCELWQSFSADLVEYPMDYKRWLYQGNTSIDRPADMGYYIGHKIAMAYFQKQKNKKRALKNLLRVNRYQKIYKKSKYGKEACQ